MIEKIKGLIKEILILLRVQFTDYCRVCDEDHRKYRSNGFSHYNNYCFVCKKRHDYHTWQYSVVKTAKGMESVAVCGIYAEKNTLSAIEKIKSRTMMPDGTVLSGYEGIRARDRARRAQDRYRKS